MSVRVKRGLVVAGLLLGLGHIWPVGAARPYGARRTAAQVCDTSIVVQGNRRVEADTIRSYFKVAPGERLDAATIDAALKALYATGLFQDVRITRRRPN